MSTSAPPPLLLVHDEPAVRSIFERLLGPVGIPVVGLGTYESGRLVLASAPRVAAIIADLHLPDGSGLDLLELARERLGRHVPLALVTADTLLEDALLKRAASAGAVSHVGILRLGDIESLVRNLLGASSTRRVRA